MFWERWLHGWRVRLREIFDGDKADRDFDEELQHHVALDIEARRERGMPLPEARRQALAAFGGLTAAKERVRASRFGAALGETLRDVRYGLRLLRRSPGFTATTVLTLALAIGATTTTFSIVDAVLIQPPAFPEPERLVTVWQADLGTGEQMGVSPANFLDWRTRAQSFAQLAAIDPFSFDFTGDGEPELLYASLVTEGFFQVLGAEAAHGRTFLPGESATGRKVVVLTDRFWQRRFWGDLRVLGESLSLDGESHTVIGVLAPDFELDLERGRAGRDLFAPKVFHEWEVAERAGGWWQVIGRLRPGVTLAEAQAEMDAITGQLAVDYPATNGDVGARVTPLQARQVEVVRPTLLLLWSAVGLVLLIACVNVANLMLARSTRREREFAVRVAMGGGSSRLARQLLVESIMIAVLGGLGGLLLTTGLVQVMPSLMPADVPGLGRVAVNARLLGFSVGLVGVTALLCGFAPARQVIRRSTMELLTSRRCGSSIAAQHRLRRLLATTEVGLALVLLVGVGLLVQSFARLSNVDLGFAPDGTVALQVFLNRRTARDVRVGFFRETLEHIRALPGVSAAGAVSSFPLAPADVTTETPLTIGDRPASSDGEELVATISLATPGYIEAMQLPLRRGRWFAETDGSAASPVAVINETLARRRWRTTDPLDQRITVQVSGRAVEVKIVGVVAAVRSGGFHSRPRPEVFVPHAQGVGGGSAYDGGMTYVARTTGDPAGSIAAIQEVIWAANPLQPFYSATTVDQLLADSLATRRFTTNLLVLFGVAALALAGMGVYGVIAVATAQRTREIGLRIAMGARPRDVVRMVIGGALGMAAVGVAAGLFAALLTSQALASLLFEVSPTDAVTLTTVSLLVLLVSACAAWGPARRAARVDLVAALELE